MASLIQWTWVWANSRRKWSMGKPGMLHGVAKSWTWLSEQQQLCKILSGKPAWYEKKNEPQSVPERKWTGEDNACKIVFLIAVAATAAKSLQSCPTLCDPIDVSPPGSPIPGILQARTLEWVAISFSIAWKWKVKVKLLSRVWPLANPWTAAYQAPLSMGFSRQEYWSGLPLLISTYSQSGKLWLCSVAFCL